MCIYQSFLAVFEQYVQTRSCTCALLGAWSEMWNATQKSWSIMELGELNSIIADVLSVDMETITLNSKFVDDLGADSLDIFQIVSEVEDRLQIQIPEDMLEQIVTVEDALNAINESI